MRPFLLLYVVSFRLYFFFFLKMAHGELPERILKEEHYCHCFSACQCMCIFLIFSSNMQDSSYTYGIYIMLSQ